MSEQYKKITFLESNNLIKEIVEKIYPEIQGIALIFGSYAKGKNKKESDLDIFIAGKCNEDNISNISKRYNINISLKIYPKNILDNPDILTKEVIENHVVIKDIGGFIGGINEKNKLVP